MENLKELLESFKVDIIQAMKDEDRFTRDLLMQEIRAAKVELRQEFRQGLKVTKDEIITEITEFIDDRLLPQIDDHEHRLVKLETKTI